MRATLVMLELASGSDVPRPTTISSVSSRGDTPRRSALGGLDALARRPRAAGYRPPDRGRSRCASPDAAPHRYSAPRVCRSSHGPRRTACRARPGYGRAPCWRSLSSPSRMIGRANSRKPEATGYCGRRSAMPAATVWNSVIASMSRLPWPQTITPILLMLLRSRRRTGPVIDASGHSPICRPCFSTPKLLSGGACLRRPDLGDPEWLYRASAASGGADRPADRLAGSRLQPRAARANRPAGAPASPSVCFSCCSVPPLASPSNASCMAFAWLADRRPDHVGLPGAEQPLSPCRGGRARACAMQGLAGRTPRCLAHRRPRSRKPG